MNRSALLAYSLVGHHDGRYRAIGNDIVGQQDIDPSGQALAHLTSERRQAEAVKEQVFVEALAVSVSGRGYRRRDAL